MPARPSLSPAAALLIAISAILAACAPTAAQPDPAEPWLSGDSWVVMTFAGTAAASDGDIMDALLDTEMNADAALAQAGAGYIDGNEMGAHEYELYFVGDDADVMWQVLEPVFAEAPIPWTRVELRNGFGDAAPHVLTRE